jgi:hypothetical protein
MSISRGADDAALAAWIHAIMRDGLEGHSALAYTTTRREMRIDRYVRLRTNARRCPV